MDIDLLAARKAAESVALSVAPRLCEGFGVAAATDQKTPIASDVVTLFDTEADIAIRESLASFDPSFGHYGEEVGATGSTDVYWLVDPIDGTGHYKRGLAFCTTMICLIAHGKVVVSVINDFVRENLYSAHRSGGATCNGSPIQVSDRGLNDAYLASEINTHVGDNVEVFQRLRERPITLMKSINCGWDFAMTACGKLDGRIQVDPWGHIWDFAPGSLLVHEAGGVVANLGTSTYDFTNLSFLAVAPRVYEELTSGSDSMFPVT